MKMIGIFSTVLFSSSDIIDCVHQPAYNSCQQSWIQIQSLGIIWLLLCNFQGTDHQPVSWKYSNNSIITVHIYDQLYTMNHYEDDFENNSIPKPNLHDIGFVNSSDLWSALFSSIVESELSDTLGVGTSDNFQTLNNTFDTLKSKQYKVIHMLMTCN